MRAAALYGTDRVAVWGENSSPVAEYTPVTVTVTRMSPDSTAASRPRGGPAKVTLAVMSPLPDAVAIADDEPAPPPPPPQPAASAAHSSNAQANAARTVLFLFPVLSMIPSPENNHTNCPAINADFYHGAGGRKTPCNRWFLCERGDRKNQVQTREKAPRSQFMVFTAFAPFMQLWSFQQPRKQRFPCEYMKQIFTGSNILHNSNAQTLYDVLPRTPCQKCDTLDD
jgi:hypothetical protein